MHSRNFAFYVLLIMIVQFSMMFSTYALPLSLSLPGLTVHERMTNLEAVDVNLKPPQLEIRLLKGVSPEDKWHTNEYKYSGKDYDAEISTEDKYTEIRKNDKEDISDNIMMPDQTTPLIGSRNIITAPELQCPEGQRKDSIGRCRPVIP